VSDTTELFTGSSGTSEASQSGPDSGPSGAATPAGETVTVITPRATVAVLAAGYRPVTHPSAGGVRS